MTIIGRPYSFILLEIEEAITGRGDTRPLIVEAAYRKIIKEYGDSLTEDEKVCLGAFRLIMEELALKNMLQIDAARHIQGTDLVQRWGINKIPNWAGLEADVQLSKLLGGLTSTAKAKAHEAIVADGKPVNGSAIKYDFDDPKAVKEKIAKIFLEDIVKQNEALP